jgi:hypothetical protein
MGILIVLTYNMTNSNSVVSMKCEALYMTLCLMPLGTWCKVYRDNVYVGAMRIQRKGDVKVIHCWNGKARNDGATNTYVRFSRAKLQAWYGCGNVGVLVPSKYKELLMSQYQTVMQRFQKRNVGCVLAVCNTPVTRVCVTCDRRRYRCKTPLLHNRNTESHATCGKQSVVCCDARVL